MKKFLKADSWLWKPRSFPHSRKTVLLKRWTNIKLTFSISALLWLTISGGRNLEIKFVLWRCEEFPWTNFEVKMSTCQNDSVCITSWSYIHQLSNKRLLLLFSTTQTIYLGLHLHYSRGNATQVNNGHTLRPKAL